MAKKDNIDLDDFDLDDFDFDVPEWGGDEVDSKSRNPVQNVLSGAIEGAKSELGPAQLKNTMTLALPAGYGLAADTLENISTDAKSLYDTITGDSPELVKISKQFGRKAMHIAGNRILPKKVADRLNDALAESESGEPLKSDRQLAEEREQHELDQLTEIFRAKAEADETRAEQSEVENIERKALDQARFKSSMEALEAINRSIARLVGYQDSVTVKYQQKSLELQYRQFAVGQKQLELMSVATGKHEKILEAIRHNTSLPEAVKIRGSEIFGLLAKQRLADGGINSLTRFARDYARQIHDNARAMFGGALGDVSSLGDQMEGSGISKSHLLGSVIGSTVTSKTRDFVAMHIAPLLERNESIARGGEKLRGIFSGLPQKINEFASSETKGTGLRSVIMEAFKRFLPQYHLDTRLGGETLLDMDQPAIYDRMARRSIIEIIPGHLADIVHWTKTLATGSEGPKTVFNPVRGGFSSEQEQQTDIGRQIISLDERNNLRNSIDDFVKTLGVEGMSGNALDIFKRKVLTELASGRDLVPERLADGASYAGADADTVDEITQSIRDAFGLDIDGKMLDDSIDGKRRFNDIRDQFYRMGSLVPGITDRIRTFGDIVGREALRNLGYIVRDGLTDRINTETAWDVILRPPEEGENGQSTSPAESTSEGPGSNIGAALRGRIDRNLSDRESDMESPGSVDRAIDATEAERRYRRRPVKLERYLGDKSTLIQILTRSRDYHAELVELFKGFSAPGGGGGADSITPRVDALKNLGSNVADRFGEYANKAGDKATLLREKAKKRWTEVAAHLAELRAQGRDHPLAKEAELWLGETKDELGDKIEWLKNYRRGGIDTRYQDKYGAGLFGQRSPEEERSKRTFKPRVKALMRKLTGGKLGGDISSELTGDPEQDNLTIGLRNAQLQWEILKQVTVEKIRKGSYLDRLTRRKQDQENAEGDDKRPGTDGPKVMGLDKIKDLLKGLAGGGIMDSISSMFESFMEMKMVKDLLGGGDRDNPSDRRERNRQRRASAPRARTRVGRGLQILRNLGGAGLDRMGRPGQILKYGLKKPMDLASKGMGLIRGAASSGAGRAIGSGLLWGAKRAGFVVGAGLLAGASFVGAPVLATIVGVVGVATTLMSVYKWLKGTDKVPPLSRLRMVQYGVNPDPKSKEVEKLLQLEQLFLKHTRIGSEGKAEVDVKAVPFEALAQIFELNLDVSPAENPTFLKMREYLNGRFAAVYLKWVGEYHALHKSMDLATVDEKLKGDEAVAFVDKVAMANREDVFTARTDPFNEDGWIGSAKLPMSVIHVQQMVNEVKDELTKEAKKRPSREVSVMGFSMDRRGNAQLNGVWNKSRQEYQAEEEARAAAEGRAPRPMPEQLTARQAATVGALNSKSNLATVVAATAATGDVLPLLRGMDAPRENAERRGRRPSVMGFDIDRRGTVRLASAIGPGAAVVTRISARDVELDSGRSVRYRIYGLTEMDAHKAAQLATLEDSLWGKVRYRDGQARIGSDTSYEVEILNKLRGEVFTYTSRKEMLDQASWLRERFVTAFLAYCTAVRKRANIDAREAHVKLEATDFLEVLRETSQATGAFGLTVWELTQSPWPNYVLNKDPASITDALSVLASRAGSKLLREPEGISQGRVKDANGEWVDVDPTQVNRPDTMGGEQRQQERAETQRREREEATEKKSLWSRFKGIFGNDKEEHKPAQQGTIDRAGYARQPTGQPIGVLRSSIPINHPGGGTGGDVNQIPEPKGDGWEANKETLMTAANMVGVDPQLAASVAGVESNFRPYAVPYRNPRRPELGVLSSAAGYYQVINSTWKYLMDKYAGKYGIAPETTQHDPRANALLGLEYIRENVEQVKGAVSGRPVAATDAYLAHFLGPGGAKRFLSAPPNAPATRHVQPAQANSNPGIFRPGGQPRTVEQVYTDFDNKLKRHAKPDAPMVAASLRGEVERSPDDYTEEGDLTFTASAGDGQPGGSESVQPTPSVSAAGPEVPSMVRSAVVESVTPDETYSAPTDPNRPDVSERATNRTVANNTRSLAATARAAEIRTETQVNSAVKDLGGEGEQVKRLVGINESQLEQLVALVSLLRDGITVKAEGGGGLETTPATSDQGTGRTVANARRVTAAKQGTVSVARS